jgi:uncharacterized protein (UPF0332 family)
LLPDDLIATARELTGVAKGKPRQSNLRRAVSTTYYALFHGLARSCADLLVGGAGSARSAPAWKQAYRALEHGPVKAACQNSGLLAKFPQEIQDFANVFVQMQAKRHNADYDPEARFYKSAVLNDIDTVEAVIAAFDKAPVKDRRAFAVLVMLKLRR